MINSGTLSLKVLRSSPAYCVLNEFELDCFLVVMLSNNITMMHETGVKCHYTVVIFTKQSLFTDLKKLLQYARLVHSI